MKSSYKQWEEIDFSALVTNAKPANFNLQFNKKTVAIASGLFGIILLSIAIDPGFLSFVLVGGLLVYLYITSRDDSGARQKRLTLFAQQNGFEYLTAAGGNAFGPSTLFTHGHDRYITDMVKGTLSGVPFRLYRYKYSEGSGKNERELKAQIMEVTLSHVMPNFVIDSKLEGGNSFLDISTLPITFDDRQKVTLEGDFNEYFDLYVPDKYNIEALSLLAPDMMAVLIDNATSCDIEIIEDKLYFYWPNYAESQTDYERLFKIAGEMLSKASRKLTQANFGESVATISSTTAELPSGAKLKTSWLTAHRKAVAFLIFLFAMNQLIVLSFSESDTVDSDSGPNPFIRIGSFGILITLVISIFIFWRYMYRPWVERRDALRKLNKDE